MATKNINIKTTADTIEAANSEFGIIMWVDYSRGCWEIYSNACNFRDNEISNSVVAASEVVNAAEMERINYRVANPFRLVLYRLAVDARFGCKGDEVDGIDEVAAQLAQYLDDNDLSYMLK